jgi:hypothetical protein
MAGFRDLSHLRARQEANDRQKYLNIWDVPYDIRQAPITADDLETARIRQGMSEWFQQPDPITQGLGYGHPEIDARVSFARRDAAEKEAIRAQVERDNEKRIQLAKAGYEGPTARYRKQIPPLDLRAALNL